MRKISIVLFMGIAIFAFAAASDAAQANVTVSSDQFTDATSGTSTTTVHVGDTVKWTWHDSDHSVTSGTCKQTCNYSECTTTCDPSGLFDSGVQSSGFTLTGGPFMGTGTFPYFCVNHGTMGMTGILIVKPADGGGCGTITISPSSLPGGIKGAAYSQNISATGGAAPYTFAVTTGSTPPGVNLNGSTGALSGTPTAHGSFSFSVTATDSQHCTGVLALTILVADDSPAGDPTVIPGVGSLPGGFGAVIRTQLQLTNPTESTIAGSIVFHPAGASAGGSDPSMSFTLSSWQTINFDDVLTSMGLSGLGSADIVPTSGDAPAAIARIYNDGGAAGTTGFAEPIVRHEDAAQAGDTAVFILPADAVNYRFNLGVRSLSSGVTATFTLWDQTGHLITTVQKNFGPDFFTQQAGAQFLGVASLPANGSIGITITQGSGIFFGSTVDNRTQDSATQFTQHR